jgi:hypothetical protein
MNGILRPKRTTIVHIRSKDADQIDPELNTNFRVNLVSPIECAQTEEIHAQLISAEIPNSAYNVSSQVGNNTIVYNDDTFTYVLPSKNYDILELVRVITAEASFPFSATFDDFTGKVTLTNTSVSEVVLNWNLSSAAKLLGFAQNPSPSIAAGDSVSGLGMADLATIHAVMVKSDLAAGNVLSTRAGNSTTLQKISIDVNSYGIIYLNTSDYRTVSVLQKPVVDVITFRLTDQNDNLLDLNDLNYEFSLQFMLFDKPQLGSRRAIEEQTATGRPMVRSPPIDIPRQTVLTGVPEPQPMVRGNDVFFIDEDVKEADDTHPVIGKTHIEKVAEKTILDHIIDRL